MNIKDFLDNSQDAETISLEIVSHPALYAVVNELCDMWDSELGQEMIATIIRELWDIAYSHGYYDGKTEAEEGIV